MDTAFQNRNSRMRAFLRESIREAFRAGVDLALANGCHAMLIAGDLFDNHTLSFTTEKFLLKEMSRLEEGDVKVFYAPGNHDPFGSTYRAKQIRWPANVHIFAMRKPEACPLTDSEGRTRAVIVGAGHKDNREGENLARLFPRADNNGVPHIGLLHALVTGSRGDTDHERYAPCTLDDLKEKGYVYWALGHIHTRGVICEGPYVVYPGNLVGRNPREDGPRGAYLVEIDDNGSLKAVFHPLAPVCWLDLTVSSLTTADNLERLKRVIEDSVRQHLEKNNRAGETILRLNLEGPCPVYRELADPENLEFLREDLTLALDLKDMELGTGGLVPPLSPDKYKNEPHILGMLLSILDSLETDDEMLLQLAPDRLAGYDGRADRGGKIEYLRTLLRGLDYEAAARLVEVDER